MRFCILGPLEVWGDDERLVTLGGPQQKALLAVLLLHPNRVVSVDRLAVYLWGEDPPPTARGLLQGCVAQLRRALRTERGAPVRQPLLTRSPGYLLQVRPDELDVDRFEELAASANRLLGERSGLERAAALLAEALALWRGPALDGIAVDSCQAEIAGLEERRLTVLEARIDVDLGLGREADLVTELQRHVRDQPLRERLRAQLMLALHGADRQADALAVYHQLRATLVEQLGVEPGAAVQQLQRAILSGPAAVDTYRQEHAGTAALGRRPGIGATARVAPPAQLPAATTAFTGRGLQLRRLDQLLVVAVDPPAGGAAITVVSGTAGVGKTALVLHWAHRVRAQFSDGQLYVNLRGYAPDPPVRPIEALAGFLQALGVPAAQVPSDPDPAAAMYRTLLADRQMLIVLDNASDVAQVRPLLPASSGCRVLVTSRHRLGGLVALDGAGHLTLDVLTSGESFDLLARSLGAERTSAETEAAAELSRLCSHLPLALRIAAAHLTCQPQRAIADEVAALTADDRLSVLEVGGDVHGAVRAAFDLSYRSLSPDVRRVFRCLGLVPGPDVTAPAAAALVDAAPPAAARMLRRLAEAHLLDQPTTGRYVLHDLLRLYAAERTRDEESAGERDAAIQRLYGFYLGTADAAAHLLYPGKLRLPVPPLSVKPQHNTATVFDGHADAVAWLDAERANLGAAARHAAEHGPRAAAWLLADTLRGYFWLRMDIVDWLAVAHVGHAAAESAGDLPGQAAAQLSLADVHRCQGRYQHAIEHYTRAATLARHAGWREGRSAALGNLGSAYFWLGRLSEAADRYAQSLAVARQAGDLAGQAVRLGNLGLVYELTGRLDQAADHHTQALALHRQLGSRSNEAIDLANLGESYHALGRPNLALDNLSQALTIHREVGDRGAEAETLGVLAAVHRDAGRHGAALDLARQALALAHETGDHPIEANALNTLATVHQHLSQVLLAIEHHHRALRLARETGTRYAEVVALVGLATAHRHVPQLDAARDCADQALALARSGGFRVLEGHALTTLAGIQLDRDDLGMAISLGRDAVAVHRETGHRRGQAQAHEMLGNALGPTDPVTAAEHSELARTLFVDLVGTPSSHSVV